MQNAQNAEIQQRVINLVELYRTKVGKESPIAKEAKQLYDVYEGSYYVDYSDLVGQEYEDWVKHLKVNDQLLGHFYSEVAGEKLNKEVLGHFLPDYYDTTVFTEEEEHFLRSHFRDIVNYIIQTPSDDLHDVAQSDRKEMLLIPNEILSLIFERVAIPDGATIYNPFTCFVEFSNIYNKCRFLCEALGKDNKEGTWPWAWMELALYANSINAEIIEDGAVPQHYDAVISYIRQLPELYKPIKIVVDKEGNTAESEIREGYDPVILSKIQKMYENLKEGGKMVLLTKGEYFWNKENDSPLHPLWKKLIEDNAIVEVIQLPSVMSDHPFDCDFVILIAEKGRTEGLTVMMDMRDAFQESDKSIFHKTLDIEAIHAIERNHGKDLVKGLRKIVHIPSSTLNPNLLLPQVYVVEKPSDEEQPVPLSSLCSVVTNTVGSIKYDLPYDTPWVAFGDLSAVYQGPVDLNAIEKADCPNNPPHTEDFVFSESGKFVHSRWAQKTSIGHRVLKYRLSTFADGSTDVIGFSLGKEGIKTALIQNAGRPIAFRSSVLCPKDGVDALSILALINMPIVYRQMQAYQEFDLSKHLDDILVPTDKRVIGDELSRIKKEESVTKRLGEKFSAMKTEYINEVRMRKHDMGQYLFELMNIEDLMRYYIENRDTEKDYIKQIGNLLDNFRSSVGELSTLLDNLSKEERFGSPELLNIDEYLSNLEARYKGEGLNITYRSDKTSLEKYYDKQRYDKIISRLRGLGVPFSENIPNEIIDEFHSDEHIENSYSDEHIENSSSNEHIEESCSDEHIENSYSDEHIENSSSNEHIEKSYSDEQHIDESYSDEHIESSYSDEHIESSYSSERDYNEKIFFPSISLNSNDFQRMVNNILGNVQKHGFTDPHRKDYEIRINASIDVERNMYIIDFCNNGNPLPEGMNKMRYGIKGEKAGKTAGTGLGGNYVKSFVEHYGGDYDIFMENGWTVVRICLPIK